MLLTYFDRNYHQPAKKKHINPVLEVPAGNLAAVHGKRIKKFFQISHCYCLKILTNSKTVLSIIRLTIKILWKTSSFSGTERSVNYHARRKYWIDGLNRQ